MAAPRVGEQFGRYRLEREVGAGGMGVVFAATDTQLDRTVAVKVISARHAADAAFRRRFEREATTLARLDSPHILTIHDAGELDGQPFIVTQYVPGGDLGAALSGRGALPAAAAVDVSRQVAEALEDAHRAGIVHRDLKPSNVLLRDPDATRLHAYLCDFGIAHEDGGESITTAGGVVGTWAYLAPERLLGAPAGPVTDIYSLGCLLWACLTGEPPYRGHDYAVAHAHQHAPLRQLTTTDGRPDEHAVALNRILATALAKHPGDRYPSAASLAADLAALPGRVAGARLVPLPLPAHDARTTAAGPAPGRQATPPWQPTASQTPTVAPGDQGPGSPHGPGAPGGPGSPGESSRSGRSRARTWLVAVAAVLAVCLVAALAIWRPWVGEDSGPPAADDGSTDASGAPDPVTSDPPTSQPATPDLEPGSYMSELAEAGTIRIGVKFDEPGMGYREPGGEAPEGFDIEVGKILAASLGIGSDDMEWVETTSVDREAALQSGEVDLVLASYSITSERSSVVGQAGPYRVTGLQFMVPSDSDASDSSDLEGERICAIEGSTTAEVVRQNDMKVLPGPTITSCLDDLRRGKAAAVAGDGAILTGYLALHAGDFTLVGTPLTDERIGVGYGPDHPEMCQWINHTLADAEADGRWGEAFETALGDSGEAPFILAEPDPCP